MDPFTLSTGGGGLSGGSSEAGGTAKSSNVFGDIGAVFGSKNYGSGDLTSGSMNWWLIGGIAAAALAALYLLRK